MMDISLILKKDLIKREEIISLLQLKERSDFELLLSRAGELKNQYFGNEIYLRGIIEFSNCCEQNCLYCGLRTGNSNLSRYRMDENQILKTAELIYKSGIKTIVMQSGEDSLYSCEFISNIIKQIKNITDSAVTLSLGERKFDEYEEWRAAGADRYLLKHETANPGLYSIYHHHQLLQDRLEHLKFLKSIGYQTGSGNLIGLPFQTIEDIADDILLCKELNADMASFSPFIPSPHTPYRSKKPADIDTILKVMAVARIVLKDVHIPATTALATMHEEGRRMGLLAGANVIMPNFTPSIYSKRYSIYPNKINDYDISETLDELNKIADSLNFKIISSRGDSLKEVKPDLSLLHINVTQILP
jgi:biotin synthase